MSSCFLASSSSFGTPWELVWALRNSLHSSLQKEAVSLSRNPVSWICRALISGCQIIPRLAPRLSWCFTAALTHVSGALNEVEAQLCDDIIFATKNLGDLSCNPSVEHGNISTLAETPEGWNGQSTHFFMTCRLTFCMSTFWLNSGGNFVLLRSFASTPVAMVANRWGVPSSNC